MVRTLGIAAILVAALSCSKSAANQETAAPPIDDNGANVPTIHGAGVPAPGGVGMTNPASGGAVGHREVKLAPEEGTLAVEPPADLKSGVEAIAKVTVTPGKGYHVNKVFPVKLTLAPTIGVTLAKSELISGGPDGVQGDADTLSEQSLAFAVKLTAVQPGSYTINGNLKFAVCDDHNCLPKNQSIAIAVAAK